MGKPVVLILKTGTDWAEQEWNKLEHDFDIQLIQCEPETRVGYLEYFHEYNVIVVANTVSGTIQFGGYTEDLIEQIIDVGTVKAVCNRGAGFDVLGDLSVWKRSDIQLSNTPTSVAIPTADTAIFLMIGAMRNFVQLSRVARSDWSARGSTLGHSPQGKILGILGMGNIGRLIRDRAVPFGFKEIKYYSRTRLPVHLELDSVYANSIDELLAESDVLILALPLSQGTVHIINAETLAKCRRGVTIVNIARGKIIEEQALVDSLNSGHVFAAGLDVFENEPYIHPGLLEHPRTLLLPHAATFTFDTRVEVELEHLANVRAVLETGKVLSPI